MAGKGCKQSTNLRNLSKVSERIAAEWLEFTVHRVQVHTYVRRIQVHMYTGYRYICTPGTGTWVHRVQVQTVHRVQVRMYTGYRYICTPGTGTYVHWVQVHMYTGYRYICTPGTGTYVHRVQVHGYTGYELVDTHQPTEENCTNTTTSYCKSYYQFVIDYLQNHTYK